MCVNIYSRAASAPTLSPCVLLPPKEQALLKHELLRSTVPSQPHQTWRQHFHSSSSINRQTLEYPSTVTQKTEMTLDAPGFQDAFASIAMVSLILLWIFFPLFCSITFFFSVAKMPHRPLTTSSSSLTGIINVSYK